MSRFPSNASKEELAAIHKAKMKGKKLDRQRHAVTKPTRLQQALARVPAGAFGEMARRNRHTLDPHTDAREIARAERRAANQAAHAA